MRINVELCGPDHDAMVKELQRMMMVVNVLSSEDSVYVVTPTSLTTGTAADAGSGSPAFSTSLTDPEMLRLMVWLGRLDAENMAAYLSQLPPAVQRKLYAGMLHCGG